MGGYGSSNNFALKVREFRETCNVVGHVARRFSTFINLPLNIVSTRNPSGLCDIKLNVDIDF